MNGEVCPNEWIYHCMNPIVTSTALDGGHQRELAAMALANADYHRRLGGAVTASGCGLEGKHIELRLTKHTGDFTFMAVTADHAPQRPPKQADSTSTWCHLGPRARMRWLPWGIFAVTACSTHVRTG